MKQRVIFQGCGSFDTERKVTLWTVSFPFRGTSVIPVLLNVPKPLIGNGTFLKTPGHLKKIL